MNRPLESLFAPTSVAVVGASEQPTKWGYWLSVGALTGRDRRSVHLVNRRGGALDGVSFAPSLAALGEPVELVVLATPAAQCSSTVDEALAAGAKAVVGITAGLPPAAQAEVAARVRAAGAVLLGPNCMGVADVTAVELLRVCAAHRATRAVAVYLEDVGDGRAFVAAAADAMDAGTPVVLLTAGRSAEGARAARSHTGALAGDAAVLTAACRAAGVRLVATPTELIEATRVAAIPASVRVAVSPAAPRRLGVVADGGGHRVVAADLAVAARLALPGFSDGLAARLAALLPPAATTGNPVDLAGGGERDLTSYAAVVAAVLESSEVDAVLLSAYFGSYCEQGAAELAAAEGEVADAIAAAVHRTGRPVYVHSMAARWEGVELIVGARRDPRFGPVVLVGFGGVLAELIADTAVDLAPVDRDGARDLLARLRGAALLAGFRGRPAVDLDALADVVVAVSRVAAAHPEITELDLNPVLATPHGAVALDCHWEPAHREPAR